MSARITPKSNINANHSIPGEVTEKEILQCMFKAGGLFQVPDYGKFYFDDQKVDIFCDYDGSNTIVELIFKDCVFEPDRAHTGVLAFINKLEFDKAKEEINNQISYIVKAGFIDGLVIPFLNRKAA